MSFSLSVPGVGGALRVVSRAGFCVVTDHFEPWPLCNAARASLQHPPNTKPVHWIFWGHEDWESAISFALHSPSCRALFLRHLFLLLSFFPFLSVAAPCTFSHHLLLFFQFLRTGSVVQLAAHSTCTPLNGVRSLAQVRAFRDRSAVLDWQTYPLRDYATPEVGWPYKATALIAG